MKKVKKEKRNPKTYFIGTDGRVEKFSGLKLKHPRSDPAPHVKVTVHPLKPGSRRKTIRGGIEWVELLESGNYDKIEGTLCISAKDRGARKNGYCCLGLWCRLIGSLKLKSGSHIDQLRSYSDQLRSYSPDFGVSSDLLHPDNGLVDIFGEDGEFPNNVRVHVWLDPDVGYSPRPSLAEANDAPATTFQQIAKIIRICWILAPMPEKKD